MRVTFVLSAFDLSGGERVISIYAQELVRRGHQVLVVAAASPAPSWRKRMKGLLRGEIVRRAGLGRCHMANTDVDHRILPTKPPRAADLPDADVIVATWWETANWIAALPSSKGRNVHFIQHFEDFDGLHTREVGDAWRRPMPKITISRWLTELARDRYGARDVVQIFNSVDTDQFQAPPRRRNTSPVVGMLYHHVAWKGTSVGFAAFERLRRDFPDARLVAFGMDDPMAGNPLPPGTTYYRDPAQDRIRDIYAQCDVWLCSSNGEGFHLPPLEAMACRCPVVSTEVGGPADIIRDGVNGYLCPVGDSAALAEKLALVLNQSEAEWQHMSDAALATATAYRWRDAADLFETALLRVAEGRPVAAA